MKLFDNERDVLPSWLTSQQASGLPELNSIKSKAKKQTLKRITSRIVLEFEDAPSIGVAVELLNVAIIENDMPAARVAAKYLKQANFAPESISRLINQTLGDPLPIPKDSNLSPITKLKRLLGRAPNNPLLWADLSREYAIFGEKDRSIKAMLGALHSGQNHRWITRIAARVCVHFDEPDRAHALILRNENVRSDPWLIATEMAVSRKAEKQSKLLPIGKSFLESNVNAKHLSELASSFATLELKSGAEKKAKKLFKQSLIQPNQNTLAQAKWAERSSGLKKLVDTPAYENIAAYEAQYWEAYSKKEIDIALEHAIRWYNEEPYSSGPAVAISYLASLLDDYDLVKQITTKGLVANPNNSTLKLNQIFAWIASNDIQSTDPLIITETKRIVSNLEEIAQSDDWQIAAHAIANIGMFLYRAGDLSGGLQRYELAEKIYKIHAPQYIVIIKINHLRETLIANASWTFEIMNDTKTLLKDRASSATPGAEYYLEKINKLAELKGTWTERFNLASAGTSPTQEDEQSLKFTNQLPENESFSKFWLPESFSDIESLRRFTDNSITPTKTKK